MVLTTANNNQITSKTIPVTIKKGNKEEQKYKVMIILTVTVTLI